MFYAFCVVSCNLNSPQKRKHQWSNCSPFFIPKLQLLQHVQAKFDHANRDIFRLYNSGSCRETLFRGDTTLTQLLGTNR